MALILHHKDPSSILSPDNYTVDTGTNLLDWMCEKWTDSDEMSSGLSTAVMLNGKVIFTNYSDDKESLLDFTIGENDCISIINRPGVSAIYFLVVIVVAVAVSLALTPSLPGDAGEQSESPNNRLQAATNSFRPGQARPEIFGSNVSYPDFIQPTYFEYINNLKIVSELGYIGEGQFQLGELRNGETPYSAIPGSSFTVYQPGATIPASLLTIHRTADPVDGQALLAPDDESIQQGGEIDTITGGGGIANILLTMIEDSTIASDLSLTVGGFISLSDSAIITGSTTPISIGTFEIVSLTIVSERTVIEIDSMTDIADTPSSIHLASTDSTGAISNYVGFFDIPGSSAEEVWFNWQMPQGIRTEGGGQLSVTLEFQIERLDSLGAPTGDVFTQNETITGNTIDSQFRTTKFATSDFPSMIAAQYRARVRRTSLQASGAAGQQVKVEQYISVTPYASLDNSTGTVIAWQRRATTFAVSASGNRNNLDVVRMLPTYNRVTGVYDVNNLQATRSFADAAAYTLIVASGRNQSTINLESLYAINDGLLHEELGYFDFTFDNKSVGLGERIESICNAARVTPFKTGGVWEFTRDEVKPVRTAMFNRRVTVGNSSKQSWLLQRPDDKDSVELTYVDPDSNTEQTLYRRVNSAGEIINDRAGTQALEIKLAGCRNFFQAWNRANLEIRRILYQRRTVNDKTLRDGMLVGLLERVGWVDPNDVDSFSGELLAFSGNIYETSERFEPEVGESYVVYITDDQGNTSNTVTATARTDTEFGFVASGLSGAFLAESSGNQLGSRYFISRASDVSASDFLLTSRKPQADGSVDVELVEYVPAMYELDNSGLPQQSVTLPESISSTSVTSTPDDSTSNISVNLNGTVTGSGGLNIDYVDTPATGIGVNFEARLTQVGGEIITGEPLAQWLQITENREWSIAKDGATGGSLSASATLEIRDSSFTENIGSSSAAFNAVVGGQVDLPASINVESFGLNTPAESRIDFLPNGSYRASGTSVVNGTYIVVADGIGSQYEIMATITSGSASDLSGNPVGVWINLGGATVFWSVSVSGGFETNEVVLNVQIRNVANNTNIDSSAVTLLSESEL